MTIHRAYTLLEVKAVDEEKREITGLATTPTTDRAGDIVEPKGADFQLPIALLWQHDHSKPIGQVTSAKVTAAGIEVKATIAKIEEPGILKDRVDEAWQSIKAGLVRGFSIGFKPVESARIDGTSGVRFMKWLWLELSAVTVPANASATIQTIKSIDNEQLAALGEPPPEVKEPPGATGNTTKPAKSGFFFAQRKGIKTMNYQERIKEFEATRAAKQARLDEIQTKATDAGRTKDASEREEFDTIRDEIKSIDEELADLRELEKINVAKAVPVEGLTTKAATESRNFATVKTTEKLDKGIEFARYAMCLGSAKGDLATAFAIAQKRFPNSERINLTLKAAVEAGTTTDATWAAPLVEYNQFAGDFVEFLRPQTIIGRFGSGSVPALRRIPFNVHVRGQTSGGAGYWVGQGAPKPVTKFAFNDTYLSWAKVANIAVLSEELMRFSNPGAESLVRDALASALIERLDTDFIDPAKAASANVSPASITNGVTPVAASGVEADDVRADIAALWATADATNLPASSAVYITDSRTARRLSLMRNALGQVEFPGISMMGGTLDGIPLIVSNYVPMDSDGSLFILAFASEIWLADDGQVVIDASREASLQMLDNPTNNSASGTPTSMVSMFQTNSVALRAERFINWQKRRTQAVAYLHAVNWGG